VTGVDDVPGPLFIPDASVLLKWVLNADDEPDTSQALDLKSAWLAEACELLVPALWVYEVGNVVGLKQPDHAPELMAAMTSLELPEAAPPVFISEAMRLMRERRVTFYDAAYHATALARNGVFVTADAAYLRKVRAEGHAVHLAEWTLGVC
jgi:predicted nucleic acid-binding protein